MMKKITSHLILLLVATAAFATDRPNVLFIAIDDLRPELGCYGAPQVKSPNLDKLAAQGMQFTRAYCQVAVCGASRASLMTGVLPTRNRFSNYLSRADEDAPNATTLPEAFKNAGYTTISNGKIFHHVDDSEAESWSEKSYRPEGKEYFLRSFDPESTEKLSPKGRGRIYEHPDVADNAYPDGQVAEKTIKDLQRLKQAASSNSGQPKPFFLACGFIKPHMPFYAPKKYWDLYERDEVKLADNRFRPQYAPEELPASGEFRSYHFAGLDENSDEFHRMMRHGYMACVSYVDKLVGDVLSELKRLDLDKDTIVVIWGDHGWHLGEHTFWGKHNTMHLATRVPLIIRVPGSKGGLSTSLVETSDIYPTLCELADIPIPATVQGKSFASVLNDPKKSFRDVIYTRYQSGDAVVTERFNYTRYSDSKSDMLYDLQKDPDENLNIADNLEYSKTLTKMKMLLKTRMAEAAAAKGLNDDPQ